MLPEYPESYLLFEVYESLFAVDTALIEEIIEMPELTYIADTPPYIAGFLNLRGEVVEILDLALCLGYPARPYRLSDYLIILKGANYFFGIIVFNILDIRELESPPLPVTSEKSDAANAPIFSQLPFVCAIAKWDRDIAFILNPTLLNEQAIRHLTTPGEIWEKKVAGSNKFNIDKSDTNSFRERTLALVHPLHKEDDNLIPLAIISLEEEYFGIELQFVKEFTNLESFTPFPIASNSYVIGFMNFHGETLTLLDIGPAIKKHRLPLTKTSKVLVINTEVKLGILIDEMVEIFFLKESDFQTPPLEVKTVSIDFITRTIYHNHELIAVIDFAKVLESISPISMYKKENAAL